jgi:L-amino acid N-acyltransferase YncA
VAAVVTGAAAARIRDADADDAPGICALYNHYVAHTVVTFELDPVAHGDMRARIEGVRAQGLPWLVAEDGDGITGYAYAAPWRTRAAYRHSVESSVYLAPHATGLGLGRTLYTALIDALRQRDVHAVIGGAALPNAASVALHESLGFVHVGTFREVGHKFGRWIDVGYWQRRMRDGDRV